MILEKFCSSHYCHCSPAGWHGSSSASSFPDCLCPSLPSRIVSTSRLDGHSSLRPKMPTLLLCPALLSSLTLPPAGHLYLDHLRRLPLASPAWLAHPACSCLPRRLLWPDRLTWRVRGPLLACLTVLLLILLMIRCVPTHLCACIVSLLCLLVIGRVIRVGSRHLALLMLMVHLLQLD